MALLRFVPTVTFTGNSPTGTDFNLSATVAYWGHSQGATEGALATPYGDWAGVLFSGQGASLKDSLVTKTSPVNIAGVVPFVLQDFGGDGKLRDGNRHPVLNLLQHYIDGADPIAYAAILTTNPPTNVTPHNVFQPYGLNDTYTPSEVQANYAIAAGLDLILADSSVGTAEDIGGKTSTVPPANGNVMVDMTTSVSAYVREYQQSGSEDGHFVAFDVPAGRADAERFLAGSLSGVVPQVGQ
jgi:hypothetical protein